MSSAGRSVSSRSKAAGFTLVEVLVSLVIAVIAVMGLVASVTAGSQLQQQTRAYGQAQRAVQQVHESLRDGNLDGVVAAYQAAPTFQVGAVTVTVQFPEEVLVDVLGGPVPVGWRFRDLDADGEVDLDPAVTFSASLLPVRVLSTWSGGQARSSFLVTER